MKFSAVLLLAGASLSLAEGHKGNRTLSTKAQCRQMEKLMELTQLAANTTKLDKVAKGNATREAAIQAKAADAEPKLKAMMANATLMDACNVIFAEQTETRQCGKMALMEHMAALVANATELATKTKNNATRADEIKAKVAADASQLKAMQANSTLTAFCAGVQTKDECRVMSKLQKEVDMSKNTTALNAQFKGNATKVQEFQARASKAAEKLQTMEANSTLTNACKSMSTQRGSSSTNADAAKASGKSGAAMISASSATVLVALIASVLMA